MKIALFALFVFGVLTLWIPAYWPVSGFEVGILLLTGVTIWKARFPGSKFPYPVIPLGFAVIWGLLQLITAHTAYTFATQTAILKWATFLGVFMVASQTFRNPDGLRWFRFAMLWFASALAVLATLQTFTSGGKVFWLFPSGYLDRVMGPFVSPNEYSSFVIAVLPFALYETFRRESGSMLHSGMAAIMYASVIAAASRAGVILATAEILAVAGVMVAQRRVAGRAVAASLVRMTALFLAFSLIVGWTQLWGRFWERDPMYFRSELNISSVSIIKAHPMWGVGLGNWQTVYPKYAIIDVGAYANQAHNDWLQWTAEGGILLALALATVFIWAVPRAVRSVWGLGVIAVFLHALVDYPFARVTLGAWLFVIVGMLSAYQRDASFQEVSEFV